MQAAQQPGPGARDATPRRRLAVRLAPWLLLGAALLPAAAAGTSLQEGLREGLREAYTEKEHAIVVQDARFAITEYNFRIVETLNIGAAIRERGNNSFPQHLVILFCNISLAEAGLSVSSHFIDHCPYRLSISETPSGVRVGVTRLPEQQGPEALRKLNRKINSLLEKILDYASTVEPFLL